MKQFSIKERWEELISMRENKFKIYIIVLLMIGGVMACKTKQKVAAIVPMPFTYPDDVKEEDKPTFLSNYTKGQVLYAINCAKCHNKTEGNQSIIPNFSLPQLMDYEIRIQYPSHQDPMRETVVSPEELEQIISFLRYKKPS